MNKILFNKTGLGLQLSDKALDYFKALGIQHPEELLRHDKELLAAYDVLKDEMSKDTLEVYQTVANMYSIQSNGTNEVVEVTMKHWIRIPVDIGNAAKVAAGTIAEG